MPRFLKAAEPFSAETEAIMEYRGTVARQKVAAGSKSEHQAVVLLTPEGSLQLRRVGGNPFRDPELEKLVGQEIVCEGAVSSGLLMMRQWQVVPKK